MRAIDKLYIKRPFFGTRKVRQHFGINRKRVQRLMRLLGLEAAQPRRSTSRPAPGHKVYPYVLRNIAITRPDQVPSATAHQWRSTREGDVTNAFALTFPLRRTQYERMSLGT